MMMTMTAKYSVSFFPICCLFFSFCLLPRIDKEMYVLRSIKTVCRDMVSAAVAAAAAATPTANPPKNTRQKSETKNTIVCMMTLWHLAHSCLVCATTTGARSFMCMCVHGWTSLSYPRTTMVLTTISNRNESQQKIHRGRCAILTIIVCIILKAAAAAAERVSVSV